MTCNSEMTHPPFRGALNWWMFCREHRAFSSVYLELLFFC